MRKRGNVQLGNHLVTLVLSNEVWECVVFRTHLARSLLLIHLVLRCHSRIARLRLRTCLQVTRVRWTVSSETLCWNSYPFPLSSPTPLLLSLSPIPPHACHIYVYTCVYICVHMFTHTSQILTGDQKSPSGGKGRKTKT